MPITSPFHNAAILSIVDYSKEYNQNVFPLIGRLIYDLTGIISTSGHPLPGEIKEALEKHKMKQCAIFGWGDNEEKHQRKHCARWLMKVEKKLKTNDLNDLTWCDVITYLMFIQSNCHHFGHRVVSKICKSPESFMNFFYKSKNGFEPEKTLEQCKGSNSSGSVEAHLLKYRDASWAIQSRARDPSQKAELLSYYWVEAFYLDKKELLLFNDLATPTKPRRTLGWTSRQHDYIPWGSVLNLLRSYYELPPLSGEYSLGIISAKQPAMNNQNEHKNNPEPCNNLWMASVVGLVTYIGMALLKK
mgnify:FL=1|tara:strand:+ start:338 stop:1243 length:906 start_codon:yes stop_codon:yes gene_type:complete